MKWTIFLLLKTSWASWELRKNQSFSPWSFLHDWFFINLQMLTERKFAFLNTAIMIFCLIYSLDIPHINQNPSSFSWFFSSLASLAPFRRMVRQSHENKFDIYFRVILLLPRETDLYLVLMTNNICKFKLHSLFIVCSLSK